MPAVIISANGVHIVNKEDEPVGASFAGHPVEINGDVTNAFVSCKEEPGISTFVGGPGVPASLILDSGASVFGAMPGEAALVEGLAPAAALTLLQEGI